MANQNRTVELQIKLQGVKSLQELEQVTSEINQELKQVAVTSKEFGQLSDLAKKANSTVKEVNSSLEGITSTEKAEAVNKLGQGMVGAFQAAAGASLMFGEKTGEELQKVIAKVGGLFAVTDGLKKVTEAFSAKNISALKATVKGWQESAVAAKLFGSTTSKALVATGLGAFVVLLGIIIANFDKIKGVGTKALDSVRDSTSGILAPLRAIIDFFDNMIEKIGSVQGLMKGLGAAITAIFQGDWDGIGAAFDNAVEKQKELNKFENKSLELLGSRKKALEDNLEIMQEEGKTADLIIKKQKEYNDQVIKLYQNRKDLSDVEKEALADAIQQNKILDIRLEKYKQESAEKQKQLSAAQLQKKIEDELATASFKRLQLDESFKQKLYKINTYIERQENDFEKVSKRAAQERENINYELDKEKEGIEEINDLIIERVRNGALELNNLDNYINKLTELKKEVEKIQPPTKESEKLSLALELITDEYQQQNNLLIQAREFVEQYEKSNTKSQGIIVNLNQQEKEKLIALEGQKKVLAAINAARLKELDATKEEIKGRARVGEELYHQLENKWDLLDAERINIANTLGSLDSDLKKTVDAKTRLEIQGKINSAQDNFRAVDSEIEAIEKRKHEILRETEGTQIKLRLIEEERLSIGENIVEVEKEQGKIIAENAEVYNTKMGGVIKKVGRWYEETTTQWGEWAAKNQEYFTAIADAISMANDLIVQQHELKVEQAEAELEKWIANEEYKTEKTIEEQEKIADAAASEAEKLADKKKGLEELLADAEGERYDQIRAEMEATSALEKQKQQEKATAEYNAALAQYQYDVGTAQRQNAANKAEHEANKAKKKAAIIQANISTALAVLSALQAGFPLGMIMAVVYGALGAIQIAAVAKQPVAPQAPNVPAPTPPVPPEFASGGYTGDGGKYEPAGIVHRGEYVVPAHVVRKPAAAQMLESLEGMRLRGYAEGGQVTQTPNVPVQEAVINYAMIGDEVARALRENPMYVSWQDWRDINSKMQFISSRASLGRK